MFRDAFDYMVFDQILEEEKAQKEIRKRIKETGELSMSKEEFNKWRDLGVVDKNGKYIK